MYVYSQPISPSGSASLLCVEWRLNVGHECLHVVPLERGVPSSEFAPHVPGCPHQWYCLHGLPAIQHAGTLYYIRALDLYASDLMYLLKNHTGCKSCILLQNMMSALPGQDPNMPPQQPYMPGQQPMYQQVRRFMVKHFIVWNSILAYYSLTILTLYFLHILDILYLMVVKVSTEFSKCDDTSISL